MKNLKSFEQRIIHLSAHDFRNTLFISVCNLSMKDQHLPVWVSCFYYYKFYYYGCVSFRGSN